MSARLPLSQLCGCCGLRSVNVHSNLLAQLAWFGDSHMWCPCSIVCHRVQQTALLSYYYLNAHKHWRVAGSHTLFFFAAGAATGRRLRSLVLFMCNTVSHVSYKHMYHNACGFVLRLVY